MSASREMHVVILCLLLVAATLAFYNPIIHNQFIGFDDSSYILKNFQVQSGLTWNTVKWSFTTFREGNWHPLTWLSHTLDYQVFDLNPAGHHYTNLLLHAANAVLLFLLLRQATGVTWPSLIVGALFALHPVNVESVAWAAERKNVRSMLFFLLALHAYDRYGRTGRRYLYLLLPIGLALGLMSKPQIVIRPLVLLLLLSALVMCWRDRRYLPVGWFWFLGTVVPMIGIITVGEQTMADRYAYLPFIGLFVAIVWTLDAVASKRRIANVWRASVVLV